MRFSSEMKQGGHILLAWGRSTFWLMSFLSLSKLSFALHTWTFWNFAICLKRSGLNSWDISFIPSKTLCILSDTLPHTLWLARLQQWTSTKMSPPPGGVDIKAYARPDCREEKQRLCGLHHFPCLSFVLRPLRVKKSYQFVFFLWQEANPFLM